MNRYRIRHGNKQIMVSAYDIETVVKLYKKSAYIVLKSEGIFSRKEKIVAKYRNQEFEVMCVGKCPLKRNEPFILKRKNWGRDLI